MQNRSGLKDVANILGLTDAALYYYVRNKEELVYLCYVRMTANAIMGALNWVPKWFHGVAAIAAKVVEEFPQILSTGLKP